MACDAIFLTHGRELFFSDLEQGDFLAESDCISPEIRFGALGTTTRVYIGHLPDTCSY